MTTRAKDADRPGPRKGGHVDGLGAEATVSVTDRYNTSTVVVNTSATIVELAETE